MIITCVKAEKEKKSNQHSWEARKGGKEGRREGQRKDEVNESVISYFLFHWKKPRFVTAAEKRNTERPAAALSSQYLAAEMYPFFETSSCLLLPLSDSTQEPCNNVLSIEMKKQKPGQFLKSCLASQFVQ